MGQLPRRLVATNSAAAVEVGAGLDNELADRDFTGDFPAGNDLKAFRVDAAVETAGYKNALRADLALHIPRLADDHFCLGVDVALDSAVNVQVIV